MSEKKKKTTCTLEYTGGSKRNIVPRYTGFDPELNCDIFCDLDSPQTCVVEVSERKALQLLSDFPGQWEMKDGDDSIVKKAGEYQTRVFEANSKVPEPTKKEIESFKGGQPSWNMSFDKMYAWLKANDPDAEWKPDSKKKTGENKSSLWLYINETLLKKKD